MKYLLTLLLGLPLFLHAQSPQTCKESLYGVVTDSETLEPLIYAKVFIQELNKGSFTGENGEFRLEGLCKGDYTLTVSHIGCGTTLYDISLPDQRHFDIALPHSQSHLDTVHIHDIHPGPKATQASDEVSATDLAEAKGKSLGDALKSVAGVSALQTGHSIVKPMIHGLHSNRVLILNNGIRQEGQQWGSEHAPEIDAFVANRLIVVKGANGVRYGSDAIAGVVLVEPAPLPDSAGIGGALNLVGMSNGRGGAVAGMLEGHTEKLAGMSWRIQSSRKRTGDVHTPDYYLNNTGSSEFNYSAALGWEGPRLDFDVYFSAFNSSLGVYAGSHIGNLTDLEAAISREEPLVQEAFSYTIGRPFQKVSHYLGKVHAAYRVAEFSHLHLTYSYQDNYREEFDKDRPYNDSLGDKAQLNYNVGSHQAELMWEHDKYHGFKGKYGLTGALQQNVWDGFFLIPNYQSVGGGAFAIERFVKLRWEVEAGIRYDYKFLRTFRKQSGVSFSQDHTWQSPSFSLGGIFRITPHLSANLNFGLAWRPPQINELYSDGLHHGSAAVEIGDADLKPEQAYNLIASIQYRNHERFSAELSVYHNYISDFINLEPELPPTLTIRGAFPTFRFTQVDARFVGADLSVSYKPWNPLTVMGKAAVVRATNVTESDYLILIAPDQLQLGLRYDFERSEKLVEPYLKVMASHTRQQTRVPEEQDYAVPPSAFTLFQVTGGFDLDLNGQTLSCGLTVDNATGQRYRNYLNRFRYYADEMGRNVLLRLQYTF